MGEVFMSGTVSFDIAPYLVVKMNEAKQLEFTIGKIRFVEVPSCIFYPSVPPHQMMKASDFGAGAEVSIPAGRISALYNWYADTYCKAPA